jgi:hypothetical protein
MILATAKRLQAARTRRCDLAEGERIYVLVCKGGFLYVGYTHNLDKRLREHFQGEGSIFTRLYKPTRLLHSEPGNENDEYHLAADLRRLYPDRVIGGEATKRAYFRNIVKARLQPDKRIDFVIPF